MTIIDEDEVRNTKGLNYYLDNVDYGYLNSNRYIPTKFALQFVNVIKLINGSVAESHTTPPFHLKMLDGLSTEDQYLLNLCFRGASKTTLMAEYLSLYLAIFRQLPSLGIVDGMLYISDSMENGVKTTRGNIEYRYANSSFAKEWIPKAKFTDRYIEFTNKNGGKLGIRLFGADTGIRGSKIFGKRPKLAILDDLVSDKDARSPTVLAAIRETILRGINPALDPVHRKVVMNGTSFNKEDPMITALESGSWLVNTYPVCERFPCSKEDFRGAWEERFSYEYVSNAYDLAIGSKDPASFFQEFMLRINSGETKLINDEDIRWYSRDVLLKYKDGYNFYITSDFAVTEKTLADDSVILVWAINSKGIIFLVDGTIHKATMDKNVNQLFKYVTEYKPQSVGIERSGQQGGLISWIETEMMNRNCWFSLASSSGNRSSSGSSIKGINSVKSKLTRFSLVVPLFKQGKIKFPKEWEKSTLMGTILNQLDYVTAKGIFGKDDAIDAISMLNSLDMWKPAEWYPTTHDELKVYDEEETPDVSPLNSYIV